jgi:hypothetical protein
MLIQRQHQSCQLLSGTEGLGSKVTSHARGRRRLTRGLTLDRQTLTRLSRMYMRSLSDHKHKHLRILVNNRVR